MAHESVERELAAGSVDGIERMGQSLLPRFGDALAVVLLDEAGNVRHAVGAHVDGRRAGVARAAGVALVARGQPSLCLLIDGDRPLLLDDGDELVVQSPGLGTMLAAAGAHALACVPVRVRGGGMLVVMSSTPARWDATDLLVLREFARCIERLSEPETDPRADAEELIAAVHHDLCNPLQAISLNLELLMSMLPEHDRRSSRPRLEQARESVHCMRQLVDELDEYLHGRRQLQHETSTTVEAAVREIVGVLSPVASHKEIRLVADMLAGDAVVKMPPRPLFRVLSNVVGNAIKYANRGSDVLLSTSRQEGRVRFVVADRGPGIAPEDCRRLFDREWLARSPLRKGSGLGLAIAKRLVEAHGGTLGVVSTLGAGSSFIIEVDASLTA
jgi:signal transduction histidine kinase